MPLAILFLVRTEQAVQDAREQRQHERGGHAPPEAADREAEAGEAREPRDDPEQKAVHDQPEEPERQDVERDRNHSHDLAECAVDEPEDERDEQQRNQVVVLA